jgi:GNAT superfamily N-acetyltransferase
MLPSLWLTERLLLRDAGSADSACLLTIFNANAHIGVWDPTFQPIEQAEMDGVIAAALAGYDARGNAFQMQAICRGAASEQEAEIIGYYHMVFGAPQPDIVWVSIFVLAPAAQNQRYGSEVLAALSRQLRAGGAYRAAWVEVWLKNWPALRLWAHGGFDRIVKFGGDPVLTPSGNGSVVLAQNLVAEKTHAAVPAQNAC